MIYPAAQHTLSATKKRKHAYFLLLILCASLFTVPEANALDCAATFADVIGERVQLKACVSDFSNANGDDDANFQFGGGVTVVEGDLLLVSLGTDTNDEVFTPPAGWTEIGPTINAQGVSSNIWTRVATLADEANPSYQFSWLPVNEKNQGYMLLFTGTSGTFNFASGDQNAQQFPLSETVPTNSPFNLILRTANIDRNALDTTLQGPGMPDHTDLIQQENTGNGAGSRVGITAAFTHQAAQDATGTENFSLQFAEGSHNRTISVEPYEFRFFLEDASGTSPTQSNVCSIKQVTLRVTNSAGGALPFNYVGQVSLSTSTNNGDWSDSGLNVFAVVPVGLDAGTATYQFAAGDANELVLNFTDTHAETVNFNVTDVATGNWQESTTATYVSPSLTINLCEFRITYGSALSVPANTMGTCDIETITIDLVDAVNADPATNYAGTVTINNNRVSSGNYSANTVPGAFSDAIADDGIATYALGIGDSQVILNYLDIAIGSNINFTITEDSAIGILDSANATFDPDLEVADCTIDIQVAPTMGVCTAGETITITILNVDGSTATTFDGEIEISTDSIFGDYVLTTGGSGGNGTLDDGAMADDGIATYDFDVGLGDVGVVQIDFQTEVLEIIQFTADETVGTPGLSVDAGSNLDLAVLSCKIVISHSTESDVCSLEQITITIADTANNTVTGFAGTVTISSGLTTDTWTTQTVAAPGNFIDTLPNDGLFQYTFIPADLGDIVVNYELLVPNAAVNFDGSSTTPGIAAPLGVDDPDLEVITCTARISVNPQMNVCSVSETVTLSIHNRDLGLANGTIGSMVINASSNKGSFISTTGVALNLNDGAPDDGVASYVFDGGEGGTVDFEYTTSTVGAFAFSSSAPNISFDAGNSTEDLNVLDCEFRISFDGGATGNDGASDVCSVQAMTIQVWNVDGGSSAIVTNYVGTANIITGSGSWFEQGGGSPGVLTDGFAQDGSATYEFVAGDFGQVTLDFTSEASGTLNFSITQGAISADNILWDPDLVVALCTFRITMVDETMSACTTEDVTITVWNSEVVPAIATNYTGTVSISTSTLHGNWTGVGVTDTPADDNGVATVDITTGGTVTITFEDFNFEDVSVNLVAGEIVEDGAFDPDLEVTGCLPSIVSSACFSGASGGLGSLPLSASPGPGRMVVMWVFWSDDINARSLTGAQFNAQAMTEIGQISPATAGVGGTMNTGVGMFAIADADLPAGGLSYAGTYTFDAPTLSTPSMCLAELADVEQGAFPQPNLVTPNLGQVNTNDFGVTGTFSTSITTSANNALVLSGASSDVDGAGNWFDDVAPNPPMSQLFFGNTDQNPTGGTAGGSEGAKSVAGLITVIDTDFQSADTSAAHIVASFNPLVAGAPEANGFVPVLLYETLSGNISYRAIGSSLRLTSNTAGGACNFAAVGTGSTSELAMPAGSTVERALLYWAGSGAEGQADLDIEFGHNSELPGLSPITGEELFIITDAANFGGLDFFASYKDVTAEVGITGNGTYTFRELGVQTVAPWSSVSACAGGWGLVVVYSNALEAFRVANIFHGFQPFQISSFTLVPRNFRMKTTDDDPSLFEPNGQITHITVEGDENPLAPQPINEALGIQDDIGSSTYNTLTNSYNPLTADFNSTVTRPNFAINGTTGLFEFTAVGSDDGAGYNNDAVVPHHPDLVPYTPDIPEELGDSWGFDVDTHYIAGNDNTGVLWNFAQPNAEAEQITTQYSTGQDLVMLLAEVISVTNFDLADLEVFKSISGPLKVDQPQDFVFTVTNNGNNGTSGGEATGLIVVADILPNGMTLNGVSGSGWTCYTGADRFSCTFDILNDCTDFGTPSDDIGCETVLNQLSTGESLPDLTADVQVGGSASFPDESNPAKNVVRLQHNGANDPLEPACIALISGSPGVIPDPALCERSPQFDNVNDLDGGATDINDIDDKDILNNNNVDSVIDSVIGLKTDLAITKLIDGDLEVGEPQTYTISVTNNGPDDTSETFRVVDNAPAGIQFDGTASGTGWVCTVNTAVQIDCGYMGVLAALDPPAVLTLPITVNGTAGQSVTNTAQVTSGTHDFDTTNTANNTDSDTSVIIAPPVASQEEFLISVSVGGNATEIGGLAPFQNDDYINYNPQTDVGTGFYDDSVTGDVDDANAVHVFKNGHIAISASGEINAGGTSTVGGLNFQPEDIVVYDPILDTATMLFDGDAIFEGPIGLEHNVDAVFVKEDGKIVFSVFGDNDPNTEDDVCILQPDLIAGPGSTCFSEGDVVQYDPADDTVTILIDAFNSLDGDDEIFTSEAQVNGIYIRVDDTDPNDVKEVYILSVNDTLQVGACAGCDPLVGTGVTPDDIIEVDLTGADPVTQNLFVGNVAFGEFTPIDGAREIDAIHVIEDGYHGHFSISQSQAGTTCAAGQITIRKHEFSHDVDTNYVGSIQLTTDDGVGGVGTWSIAVGNGALTNVGVDDGIATYTFDPTDNGEVTLFLSETDVSTIDVNVTNLTVQEQEDPAFIFSNVIADITYEDFFTSAAFDNNDGITVWASPWSELDNAVGGTGVATGNVIVSAGSMQFTTESGLLSSEMSRVADLSLFPISNDLVELSFDFKYSSLNSPADRFIAEVRENSGADWEEVWVWDTSGTNGVFQGSGAIDLKAAIEAVPRVWAGWSSTTEIRFKVDTGYTGTSLMFIDNVKLQTGTTTCGIGVMDHWEISIDGLTTPDNLTVGGISCLASQITFSGHDANHVAAEPGEAVTFRALSETLVEKGSWFAPTLGSGPWLDSGTDTDGLSTYTFPVGETQVRLNFNYTDPTLSPESVSFDVTSAFPVAHDPALIVRDLLVRFYNHSTTAPNDIGRQISGKPSNIAAPTGDILIVQVLTVDLEQTDQCIPLIDVGETLPFSFALECIDADTCDSISPIAPEASINGVVIPDSDSNGGNGASSYAEVPLTFENFGGSGIAAEIVLEYEDAGNVQLHAQFDVPTNIRVDTLPANIPTEIRAAVGTPLETSSNVFTVRPFGLDIDFSDDRQINGTGIDADSYAADFNGTPFSIAGVGFSTTVTGVQYDEFDDLDFDGVPDTNSELWDNVTTPNFGNDSTLLTDNDYLVRVDAAVVAPALGVGVLTDNDFTTFSNGAQTHSMTFDEVGIIDLTASLLDPAGMNPVVNYMDSSETLVGQVRNVGRFYPAFFTTSNVTSSSIISRVNAAMELTMCLIDPNSLMGLDAVNRFTYMGEEFGVSFDIEARNGAISSAITENYTDDFAKLDLDADSFVFYQPIVSAADTNYSDLMRITAGSSGPTITWPGSGDANRGTAAVTGNLIFQRDATGVEDGPYSAVSIGLNVDDADAFLTLDVDIDDVMPPADDVKLIGTENFRYGRMVIDNAFGPETEELGIPFRIEYWVSADSTWVTNDADSCTVLGYNASEDDSQLRSAFYVEGTWTGAIDVNSNSNGDGETALEVDNVVSDTDVVLSFSGGQTGDTVGGDPDNDVLNDDRPLFTTAPGLEGSLLIEFNLTHASLPYPLDFLAYNWSISNNQENDDGDAFDEVFTDADGDYDKNPRGQIIFGSYRGHDRVINWQEIYIGPTGQ